MITAVFPGTFDPPTYGHLNIIERTCRLFDSIDVAISINPDKTCRAVGAKVLLRGIRNTNDFSYEFDLSLMNRSLNGEVETLFVPTEQRYFLIRSSSIKEVARFGGDISGMVPSIVVDAIKEKYKN